MKRMLALSVAAAALLAVGYAAGQEKAAPPTVHRVVTTIDKHGLKHGHLKKHDRGVGRFFESLAGQSFRSETAEALRQRLLKNRDKLFTFMQYDGVPWNNTNAENAIKRFASYREHTVGMMKEEGLNDYLVLLSLCQTCRYRGISFLKFLLSRERDLDVYGAKRRARRHRPRCMMRQFRCGNTTKTTTISGVTNLSCGARLFVFLRPSSLPW